MGLIGLPQPLQKLHHRYAVFQHSRTETGYLPFVLDGFHTLDGRLGINHLSRHTPIERIVHFVAIHQDIIFEIVLQTFLHLFVGRHPHPFLLQVAFYLRCQLHLIYI